MPSCFTLRQIHSRLCPGVHGPALRKNSRLGRRPKYTERVMLTAKLSACASGQRATVKLLLSSPPAHFKPKRCQHGTFATSCTALSAGGVSAHECLTCSTQLTPAAACINKARYLGPSFRKLMPQVPRKCASLLLRSDTHEPDERDMRVLLLLAYWVRYIAIPTLSFSMVY